MNKFKKTALTLGASALTIPLSAQAGIFDSPMPESKNDILNFVWAVQNLLLGVASAVVFLVVIYAGILYVTAYGDTSKLEKAKKTLLYAFIGLSLVVFSRYLVVTFIKLIGGNVYV